MITLLTFATDDAHGDGQGGHISVYPFLFQMVTILLAAKVGGEVFETLGQPAVLGELVFGMVLGNLYLIGLTGLQGIHHDPMLLLLAEVGVILLLFEVGLESHLDELLEVGKTALIVALLGIVVPIVLGYGVSSYFLPEAGWYVHLFAGATLAATSVGITARVLKDLDKMDTKETRIILGAAVVDDVLGLIILAVASGVIKSIGEGGSTTVSLWPVVFIIGKSILFLVVAVFAGRYIGGKILHFGATSKVSSMAVVLSVCHCFSLAGLAALFGLAPIVGAFAAGLVLDKSHYEGYPSIKADKYEEIVSPISSIFVPVFFVLMGLNIDLRLFLDLKVITFAIGLSLAAIIGVLAGRSREGFEASRRGSRHDSARRGRTHLRGNRRLSHGGRRTGVRTGDVLFDGDHGDGNGPCHAASAEVSVHEGRSLTTRQAGDRQPFLALKIGVRGRSCEP